MLWVSCVPLSSCLSSVLLIHVMSWIHLTYQHLSLTDWLDKESRLCDTLFVFLYDFSVYNERRDKLLKPSARGSRVIPPDKQTSLCLCVPQSNTNKANIDETKWHCSYVDLCRSMWLHCGLLNKLLSILQCMWDDVRGHAGKWGKPDNTEHVDAFGVKGGCSLLGTVLECFQVTMQACTHAKH